MTSKRYKQLPEKTNEFKAELIEKLIPDIKKNCTTKFDESIDLSIQINNKQKKSAKSNLTEDRFYILFSVFFSPRGVAFLSNALE